MSINVQWDKAIEFPKEEPVQYELNDSTLIILRKSNRWIIEHQNIRSEQLLKKEIKPKIYATSDAKLLFAPALPSDPVVLKPSNSIFLMPHQKMELYIPVPLWIQIYSSEKKEEELLTEIPSTYLSDTWFGEPQAGEKAYSLHFDESFMDPVIPGHYEIICPVSIQNTSPKQLEFHRLALRVMHLSIYQTPQGLMTNKSKIKFSGDDLLSEVQYDKKAPVKQAIRLNLQRVDAPSKMPGKSFSFTNRMPVIS